MTTQTPPLTLLYLEDSDADFALAIAALRNDGIAIKARRVETLDDFTHSLERHVFDAILADYHLAGFTALDALRIARRKQPRTPFIIVSGAIGEVAAINAIHRGASDYVLKDGLQRLPRAVKRAIDDARTLAAKEEAEARLVESESLLGELAQHLQTSIEEERTSIAREIHDDIGGALTALKFDLAWIGRRLNDPALNARLASALDTIDHALHASQRIMLNLRPAVLDQGLVAAVEWLTRSFETRTGLHVEFSSAQEQIDAPPKVQEVAYRTVQEALTNIVKHANATRVTVTVACLGGHLTVEVSDDGAGIGEAHLAKPRSFGIRGLRERARAVGGWLDIGNNRGGGTIITLTVPLPSGKSAHG